MLSLLCCLVLFSLGLTLDAPVEAQVVEVLLSHAMNDCNAQEHCVQHEPDCTTKLCLASKLCSVIRSTQISRTQNTSSITVALNLKNAWKVMCGKDAALFCSLLAETPYYRYAKARKELSVEQPGVSPRSSCACGKAAAAAADDTCLAAIAVPASS